jgi:hypothetical protein
VAAPDHLRAELPRWQRPFGVLMALSSLLQRRLPRSRQSLLTGSVITSSYVELRHAAGLQIAGEQS